MFGGMKKLVSSFGIAFAIFIMLVAVVLGVISVVMSGYFITLFMTIVFGGIWYKVYKRF